MSFYIKKNDTSPAFQAILKDGAGDPINLDGATVRFHMKTISGTTSVVDASASIITASSGVVRYNWDALDTANAGSYQAEFEVTYPDAAVETFPNDGYIRVEIISDIA